VPQLSPVGPRGASLGCTATAGGPQTAQLTNSPSTLLDRAQNRSIITSTKGGPMPCMKRGTKNAAKKTAKKKKKTRK